MLGSFKTFSLSKKGVKNAIVQTLSRRWPLNARNIYLDLKKSEFSSTYQGVYKSLRQLREENIVSEEKRLYSLNPIWIADLKRFALDLETARVKLRPPSVLDLPLYGSGKFEHDGVLVEPYFWMLDQAQRIYKKTGKTRLYFFMRRAYPLIVLDDSKYSQFKLVTSSKDQRLVVKFDRFSDRYFLSMWQQHGFKGKTGVPFKKKCDICICGDYIFQIVMPQKAWHTWDKLYALLDKNHTNSIVAQRVAFDIRTKSTFLFSYNPEFAEQLRREAKSYF